MQYLVAGLFALVVLIPLVATVINGFKSNADLLLHPFGLPETWQWENYTSVLQSAAFWRQLLNSTMVMVATAIGVVVLASMPAFVFARMTVSRARAAVQLLYAGSAVPDRGGDPAAVYHAAPGESGR